MPSWNEVLARVLASPPDPDGALAQAAGDPFRQGDVVQRADVLPLGRTSDGRTVLAAPNVVADPFASIGVGPLATGALGVVRDAASNLNMRSLSSVARGVTSGAQEAGAGLVGAARSGGTFAQDFLGGRIDPGSEGAAGRALDMAGLAMTGSMPFKAPAGAIRSFGGAAAKDDPLAALEAMLADIKPEAPPPGPRLIDPTAKSWDLYHGSTPGPDFARFDPALASNPAERGAVFFAPDAETAANYAGSPKAGAEAGSRVYRTTVDPGRTGVIDLAHLAETDPAFNAQAREITAAHNPANTPLFDDYMASFRSGRAQGPGHRSSARRDGVRAQPKRRNAHLSRSRAHRRSDRAGEGTGLRHGHPSRPRRARWRRPGHCPDAEPGPLVLRA